MSDLFRKEAVENRSRALYGEVVLTGSIGNWVLTGLVFLFALIGLGILFGLKVDTDEGAIRLITWLLYGA
jgi:hypothetical protein